MIHNDSLLENVGAMNSISAVRSFLKGAET